MATPTYFNPGCALSIYKPELQNKILQFLNQKYALAATNDSELCMRGFQQYLYGKY